MLIKQLIYFIYVINIQIVYSYNLYTYENITHYTSIEGNKVIINYKRYINVYDKDRTLSKSEVLRLKNKFYDSYYYKNKICVRVDSQSLPLFVEIPDEYHIIRRYICKSFSYNDFKLGNYFTITHAFKRDYVSNNCTSDIQCLTNKCMNNICIFNEESPTEFCTNVYGYSIFFGKHSYMHCGKEYGDSFKRNKECASKNCLKDGVCSEGSYPSDTDGLLETYILIGIGLFTLFIYCWYYYFIKPIYERIY